MNGKKSKMLRRKAEEMTIGKPKAYTRIVYKQLKKAYKGK